MVKFIISQWPKLVGQSVIYISRITVEEQIMWAQKARANWYLKLKGERNAKYYHFLVNKRRFINRILRLKLHNG